MQYRNRTIRGVFDHRLVRVLSIGPSNVLANTEDAYVVDVRTKSEFRVPLWAPHRIRPQVGDFWMVTDSSGSWNFDSLVSPMVLPAAKTLQDVIDLLASLGLIDFQPDEAPTGAAVASAHSAYVGEVRLFRGATPDGWLECDGSAVSRTRYWRLFDAIGTTEGVGDGSTTFNLPTYAAASPARYAICAS